MELKSCPFCGKEAKIIFAGARVFRDAIGADTFRGYWKIKCGNCGIEISNESEYYLTDDEQFLTNIDGRRKAIDRWNRRANDV